MTHQTSFWFNPPKPKLDKKFPAKRQVELPWDKVELVLYEEGKLPDSGPTVAGFNSLDCWLSEEELVEMETTNDPDDVQDRIDAAWNFLTEEVAAMLKAVSDRDYYRVDAKNLGWQHRSGMKYVKAENAVEFFQSVLPKTDVSLKVWLVLNPSEESGHKPMLVMLCSHHDAPGGETYYVNSLSKKEWKLWDEGDLGFN